MKIIEEKTEKAIAEIIANHRMTLDECIECMGWEVNDDGEIIDRDTGKFIAYYDDVE